MLLAKEQETERVQSESVGGLSGSLKSIWCMLLRIKCNQEGKNMGGTMLGLPIPIRCQCPLYVITLGIFSSKKGGRE